MYRIVHKRKPPVGSVVVVNDDYETEGVASTALSNIAQQLVDMDRSFTYVPPSRRQDGSTTQHALIVADQGDRWEIVHVP